MTSPSLKGPRWSREQIRAARLAPLVPLLKKRGLELIAREAELLALAGTKSRRQRH